MAHAYRDDFPLLKSQNIAYLDNAATAQRPQCVLDAVTEFYKSKNANPLRGLYPLSIAATEAYENAREAVRSFLNAKSSREIIFTRNTTESINLVAYSYGLSHVKAGDEVLVSIMEHHSNLLPWQMVCRQTGASLKFMECEMDGTLDLNKVEALITPKTKIVAGIPEYLMRNFGPSFQTEQAMEEIESAVCTGIHEERKLLFTDGLSADAYEGSEPRAQSLRASRDGNLKMLQEHEDAARQGIRSIEQAFRNALSLRSEPDVYRADHGVLQNDLLWKVSRCENPQLFEKIVRQEPSAVVVELLIDASGSQSVRQSMVALQSYLFSAALSRIRIPHRVMSYCTYGNYTVLRRFRDYDDKSEADRRILEYRATSNNRDGLALAAAGLDLKKRREEHKIIIVFSDGLPNDMVSGRKREGAPEVYVGDAAIRDTCFQVRKLRREGAHVIGIFLGEDGELENERMIYGASFLRIRRAEDFAGSAGKRLSETLLNL